jgi:hypothetical protein
MKRVKFNNKRDTNIVTLETNGRGYWSSDRRYVEVNKFALHGNELRVYFKKRSWNVDKHGLIYTDPKWIKELRQFFSDCWMKKTASKHLDYSEQGMQGDNYVSLDVSDAFINELFMMALFPNMRP